MLATGIRCRHVGQTENIIGRGLIIQGKLNQHRQRELALTVFILRIGILTDVQVFGKFGLSDVPILTHFF